MTIVFPLDLIGRNAFRYVFASRPGVVLLLSLAATWIVAACGYDLGDWEVRAVGAAGGVLFVAGNAWYGIGVGTEAQERVRAGCHSLAGLLGSWFFVGTVSTASAGPMSKVAAGIACYMMMVLPAMASYWECIESKSTDNKRVSDHYYGLIGARAISETAFIVAIGATIAVHFDPATGMAVALSVLGILIAICVFGLCASAASFDYRDAADAANRAVVQDILDRWEQDRWGRA